MKTPIAAILADTHLKEENAEIVKEIFRQATRKAKELGLQQLDHAGDIFNSRKAQTQPVLLAFKEILDEMWNEGMQLYACPGNHDKVFYGSGESFLDPFASHPAFELEPYAGFRELDGINIHYAAFLSDEQYVSQMNYLHEHNVWNLRNVLITHVGISGATMNNSTVIHSDLITPSLFKDFDLTIVGHYHDAQILADGRIKYCGASLQHNFGEMTGKGLTVLYDDLTTEIIPLQYPQYIKYEVSPKDLTAKDIADIKQEVAQTGDNIRVVLTGTDAEVKAFNKQLLIDAGVSVQNKADDISIEKIESRIEAFDANSLYKEFEIFCEKNKLDLQTGMKYFKHIIGNVSVKQMEVA